VLGKHWREVAVKGQVVADKSPVLSAGIDYGEETHTRRAPTGDAVFFLHIIFNPISLLFRSFLRSESSHFTKNVSH